jgi:hypothetical protein
MSDAEVDYGKRLSEAVKKNKVAQVEACLNLPEKLSFINNTYEVL